jgi:hypothetical protein
MSTYEVNKLCHRLHHDRAFREAVQADPAKAVADCPLSDAERKALLEGDIGRLYEMGTHPYLLGHISRWSVFGVTPAVYAERIKDAREPA